jgi:hypothetical protein
MRQIDAAAAKRHRADMPEPRLGSPNAKKPFPKMLSSQPEGKTKMDDET